jgi:putative spermidine/putrescine transport system permease protein
MRRISFESLSFHVVMMLLAGFGILLLVMPTAVVLVMSFTSGASLKFPPPGFSLRWYDKLLDAWQLQQAAMNSLTVATWATLIGVAIGVPAALALGRASRLTSSMRGLDALFSAPLILPAMALGLAMLLFFSIVGMPVSIYTLIIGHAVACTPFIVRTTGAAVTQLDPALLEGSASLGASRAYTCRHITLPLIRPGILAGAFIAFMFSFDNVGVSLFLRDARTEMLPIRLWLDLETRLDVTVAAASGVLVGGTIILVMVAEWLSGLSRRI